MKILITTSLDIRFKQTIDENVEIFIKKVFIKNTKIKIKRTELVEMDIEYFKVSVDIHFAPERCVQPLQGH